VDEKDQFQLGKVALESSEDIDQSNGRGQKRTRRTRPPVVIVDARKAHRKHKD
jgi:hypothetical protein